MRQTSTMKNSWEERLQNSARGVFFCYLEGHFKSDCPQFRDAVADTKHLRH